VIILGTAVPVLSSIMDGYRLTLSAQSIVSQMQFARMKSVSSNESFRVHFPADTDVYQVESSTGTILSGPFTLPDGVVWNAIDGGTGVDFSGRYVEFSPTGSVAATGAGSQGRVRLINRAQVRIDVIVGTGGVIRQTAPFRTATHPN
jgi:hypothetical protein